MLISYNRKAFLSMQLFAMHLPLSWVNVYLDRILKKKKNESE
jgi:hypothetical protein